MGSRRDDYDDEYDRPPRRRRRYDDEYDDYDDSNRPRRHRPRRRSSGGADIGKVIGIIVGVLAAVGVIVALVVGLRGSGFGTGSMTFADYDAINEKTTIAELEKRHGRARKIDPSDWGRTGPGMDNPRGTGEFGMKQGTTLAGYSDQARSVTAWYKWKKGQEEVFVAEGTDLNGRPGLVVKIYWNPKVLEEAIRKGGGARPVHPWFATEQIGVGGKFELGGRGGQ